MRLGQTFHAYASMVERDRKRIADSCKEMYTVNLGGTAIGSAINVSDAYFYNVVPCLQELPAILFHRQQICLMPQRIWMVLWLYRGL